MMNLLDHLFIRKFERNNGDILHISQSELGDVGCVVWDAAIVLSKYLETEHFKNEICIRSKTISITNINQNIDQSIFQLGRVIELGAGTGIVGIQAAISGANCTITDIEELLPLMQYNIEHNSKLITSKGRISAETLKWNCDLDKWRNVADIILLADCVYYEEAIEDLVSTINTISNNNTIVFCAHEDRIIGNKERMQNQFFMSIGEKFDIIEIEHRYHDVRFRSDDIHIHKFTRKS